MQLLERKSNTQLLFDATDRVVGQERARKQLSLLLARQIEVAQGKWERAENAIVCGWTGCMAPESLITVEQGNRAIADLEGFSTVRTIGGPANSYIYRKGVADLLRVVCNEGEFLATGQHRVLTIQESGVLSFQPVSSLRSGERLLKSSFVPHLTNSSRVRLIHLLNARSFDYITQDNLENYSVYSRRYDELLHLDLEIGQGSSPLSSDVLLHTRHYLHEGVLEHVGGYNHLNQWFSLPSKSDYAHREVLCSQEARLGQVPSKLSLLLWESHQNNQQSALDIALVMQALEVGIPVYAYEYPFDTVLHIENNRRDEFFDAIIAGPPCYFSSGFIHHNSGKSYLVRMMCEYSGLPFADMNATQYTESGYAGEDLSQMFLPLLESAAQQIDREQEEYHPNSKGYIFEKSVHNESSVLKRDDIDKIAELASTGVILLDEFDKWMHRINHHTGRLDTAIQSELLKMVEGSIVYISDSEDEVGIPFDTSKVLILCAGAFVGLTQQVLRRLERDSDYLRDEGFWQLIEQRDFVKYGVIPELAGRLSKMIFLRPLQKEDLARIILLPDGLIDELKQRFEQVNCEWNVSDTAIVSLADIALRKEVGARGIDSVLWTVFNNALYEASVSEFPTRVNLNVNQLQARISLV